MPVYQDFPIADPQHGLFTGKEPWLSPADAFQTFENGYIDRGRILKRQGYKAFSRLESATSQVTLSGNGTTVAFSGTISAITSTEQLAPGQVTIAHGAFTDTTDTDNSDGTGTLAGAGAGTVTYATGVFSMTFTSAPASGTDNVTVDAFYYRSQPVQKITQRRPRSGPSVEELIAFDQDRLFVLQSSRFVDKLGSDTFTGDETDFYQVHNFDTYVTITNNKDAPRTWDGTTLATLGVSSTLLTQSRWIVKYKGRLLHLNTIENGLAYPRRVRYSGVAAFETLAASDWVEADAAGEIVSAGFVGDDLIIFFDNPPSTWKLVHTGDFRVGASFRFIQLSESSGSSAPYATVGKNRQLITLHETQFTVTNGAQVGKLNEANPDFTLTMNIAQMNKSQAVLADELDQAWISYTAISDTNPNNVAVFNTLTGSMFVYTLPFSAYGRYTEQTSLTWADFDGASGVGEHPTLQDDSWQVFTDRRWNEVSQQSSFPITLGGTRTGYVRQFNSGTQDFAADDTTPQSIVFLLKTGRLNPFKPRRARMGTLSIKATRTGTTAATAATLTVRFFQNYETAPYLTKTVTLEGAVTTEKVIKRILVNKTADFHTIEITSDDDMGIELDWINPTFQPVGRIRRRAA